MFKIIWRAFCLVALTLVALGSVASAQDTVRIRGTIEKVDGAVYVVKSRDGSELKVSLTDNPLIVAIVKASLSDIKPGSFVGATGMPQPDGSQKAIEVHIFPESMRAHSRRAHLLSCPRPRGGRCLSCGSACLSRARRRRARTSVALSRRLLRRLRL